MRRVVKEPRGHYLNSERQPPLSWSEIVNRTRHGVPHGLTLKQVAHKEVIMRRGKTFSAVLGGIRQEVYWTFSLLLA